MGIELLGQLKMTFLGGFYCTKGGWEMGGERVAMNEDRSFYGIKRVDMPKNFPSMAKTSLFISITKYTSTGGVKRL